MRPDPLNYTNEDEFWNDIFEFETGYTGDARHCPRHPNVVTSSADGMHDGLCGECEAAMDRDDLCEACGRETANHETDHGILCDGCFTALYPKGDL
jgi:hypothetical protein